MAKSTSGSHIADGQYNVTIETDKKALERIIEDLGDKLAYQKTVVTPPAKTQLDGVEVQLTNALGKLTDMIDDLNTLLEMGNAPQSDIEEAELEVKKATAEVLSVKKLKAKYKFAYDLEVNKEIALEKKIIEYTELSNDDIPTTAWSCDLANGDLAKGTALHDFTNPVATVELNNDGNSVRILRPEYLGAAYVPSIDYTLKYAQLPYAGTAFWNKAMLPGFQKWLPTYKAGTVKNLNKAKDRCDIQLDAHEVGGVSTNQKEYLSNVPIEYMTCNGEAFTDGDHVVVQFVGLNYEGAKVIGYVNNPQECDNSKVTIDNNSYYRKIYNCIQELIVGATESCVKDCDANYYWHGACTLNREIILTGSREYYVHGGHTAVLDMRHVENETRKLWKQMPNFDSACLDDMAFDEHGETNYRVICEGTLNIYGAKIPFVESEVVLTSDASQTHRKQAIKLISALNWVCKSGDRYEYEYKTCDYDVVLTSSQSVTITRKKFRVTKDSDNPPTVTEIDDQSTSTTMGHSEPGFSCYGTISCGNSPPQMTTTQSVYSKAQTGGLEPGAQILDQFIDLAYSDSWIGGTANDLMIGGGTLSTCPNK